MNENKVKELIEKYGIPGKDNFNLPNSNKKFKDNKKYKIEISGIENVENLKVLISEAKKYKIKVDRIISMVTGATLLTEEELKDFSSICRKNNIEAIMTPGPRAIWDNGRQILTPEGSLSGLRIRGSNNLNYIIQDIMRGIECGFKGFLIMDEGLLCLLNAMRKNGDIPKDIIFKVSIYAGHGNGASFKLLQNIGANSINPLGDLSLPMLSSIRSCIDIPMDIHVILADSFGGYNRIYECPEIVRICSPCFLKIEPGNSLCLTGGLYKSWTDNNFQNKIIKDKVKYAHLIKNIIGY
jgi:hypothetical protein